MLHMRSLVEPLPQPRVYILEKKAAVISAGFCGEKLVCTKEKALADTCFVLNFTIFPSAQKLKKKLVGFNPCHSLNVDF